MVAFYMLEPGHLPAELYVIGFALWFFGIIGMVIGVRWANVIALLVLFLSSLQDACLSRRGYTHTFGPMDLVLNVGLMALVLAALVELYFVRVRMVRQKEG